MEVNLDIFLKLLKINAAVISGLRLKKVNKPGLSTKD